jgi:hypothetical protein
MRRSPRWLAVPVLALALWAGREAAACPNCKEAVAAQDDVAALGGPPSTFMKNGYNWSVLFMMAMPFTLLGTGAFLVVRAVKRGALPEL